MTIGRLGGWAAALDEILTGRTLGYCERCYGANEIPEGRHYFELLIEAIHDPVTWDSIDDVPALLDQLGELNEKAESDLVIWAPLLIADPRLAEIGARGTRIHDLSVHARLMLELIVLDMAYRPCPIQKGLSSGLTWWR